jgi:hypothetical protein
LERARLDRRVNALLFRLGFALIGPPVGKLVDRLGLAVALACLAIACSAATLLCFHTFRRVHSRHPSG